MAHLVSPLSIERETDPDRREYLVNRLNDMVTALNSENEQAWDRVAEVMEQDGYGTAAFEDFVEWLAARALAGVVVSYATVIAMLLEA
jgi:hypothetical protein